VQAHDQIRDACSTSDRQRARLDVPAIVLHPRRRRDRIELSFAAVHESLHVQVFGDGMTTLSTRGGGRTSKKEPKHEHRGKWGTGRGRGGSYGEFSSQER